MATNTEVECKNFENNVKRAYLIKGNFIRITKTKNKEGCLLRVEVGESKEGHISKPLEFNEPLYFYEMKGQWATGVLKNVFIEKDVVYIETRNSIYKVTFL
jgi:hypothetical protein